MASYSATRRGLQPAGASLVELRRGGRLPWPVAGAEAASSATDGEIPRASGRRMRPASSPRGIPRRTVAGLATMCGLSLVAACPVSRGGGCRSRAMARGLAWWRRAVCHRRKLAVEAPGDAMLALVTLPSPSLPASWIHPPRDWTCYSLQVQGELVTSSCSASTS
jgi:hypothetical protein